MFERSTTRSINCACSGTELPSAHGCLDILMRPSSGFRSVPATSAPLIPARPSMSPVTRTAKAPVLNTRFGPSPLVVQATMTSADSSRHLLTPLNVSSTIRHAVRPPRVMRTHRHAYARRIYPHAFRSGMGLQRYLPPYPACRPLMRFLFVGPALCLRLPSHNTSRYRGCRSANTSP